MCIRDRASGLYESRLGKEELPEKENHVFCAAYRADEFAELLLSLLHISISRVYQAHIPTFAAGYWLFGFASKKYHPIDDLDAEAWKALNMRTDVYKRQAYCSNSSNSSAR